MIRRGLLVGAVAATTAAAGVWPAAAADTAIVAGPGSARTGEFATPAMAVQAGSTPSLVNLDVNWHGLESEDTGPDDRSWCGPLEPNKPEHPVTNPRRKPLGECPLFWADFVTLGGTAPVLGLEGVESGRVYAYRCTVVPGMGGNLFVV